MSSSLELLKMMIYFPIGKSTMLLYCYYRDVALIGFSIKYYICNHIHHIESIMEYIAFGCLRKILSTHQVPRQQVPLQGCLQPLPSQESLGGRLQV